MGERQVLIALFAVVSIGAALSAIGTIMPGWWLDGILGFLFLFTGSLLIVAKKILDKKSKLLSSAAGTLMEIDNNKSFTMFLSALKQLKRRGDVLIPELIEKNIESPVALAHGLGRIAEVALRHLHCESAEIALFNKEDGQYHSSITLGKPFRTSIDERLSGLYNKKDTVDHLEPISFAGTVLGALRVGSNKERVMNDEEKAVLRILALQASVAIVNADFLKELLKMREHSQASQKARTGFLANLSHELRGPLGNVLNASELLREELCGPLTTDQKETLEIISKNGVHVLELLNDVLDYARVESGKVVPQPISISTKELLLDIASVVRPQADVKHHTLCVKEDADLYLTCDRRHIRQMCINLLTNAIKYTPENGTITLWAESSHNGKVKVCVQDSGIGIAPEDKEKVFGAFERIDNAYARKQIGTGLGMSLTKRLAEVNNGAVDFDSTVGRGTTFWLLLPASISAPDQIESLRKEEIIYGDNLSILLISTASDEGMVIGRYFKERRFQFETVSTLQDVIRAVNNSHYSIIVIDDSAIFDFDHNPIFTLRNEIPGIHTPIILLSGEAFNFNVEENLRSGIDRHITKPIALSEMTKICSELAKSEQRLIEGVKKKSEPRTVLH